MSAEPIRFLEVPAAVLEMLGDLERMREEVYRAMAVPKEMMEGGIARRRFRLERAVDWKRTG